MDAAGPVVVQFLVADPSKMTVVKVAGLPSGLAGEYEYALPPTVKTRTSWCGHLVSPFIVLSPRWWCWMSTH